MLFINLNRLHGLGSPSSLHVYWNWALFVLNRTPLSKFSLKGRMSFIFWYMLMISLLQAQMQQLLMTLFSLFKEILLSRILAHCIIFWVWKLSTTLTACFYLSGNIYWTFSNVPICLEQNLFLLLCPHLHHYLPSLVPDPFLGSITLQEYCSFPSVPLSHSTWCILCCE